jgi:sugar phosphate isomerase/epimerase
MRQTVMLIQSQPPLHLTYCLNIHPGETWAENFASIREKALRVKERVAPDQPFGLGLRLSRHTADSLASGKRRADVRKFFDDHGLYVFTINGFPYGQFHGARVKENVYAPDWRTPERRDYTNLLADILADFLPGGVNGSISTVPVSFKPWIVNESDLKSAIANLTACAEHLADTNICLALEPEPGCYLETTEETIRFLAEHVPDSARRRIGVCFDTCHAAVQFENVAQSLQRYLDAGIRVAKVQLSAAVEETPEGLKRFEDAVYLHQTKAKRRDGSFQYWNDLPEAVAAVSDRRFAGDQRSPLQTIRSHFHVPLFAANSTAAELTPEFFKLLRQGATEHLEIETYTFDVLPPELRAADVVDHIVREYEWVMKNLSFPFSGLS